MKLKFIATIFILVFTAMFFILQGNNYSVMLINNRALPFDIKNITIDNKKIYSGSEIIQPQSIKFNQRETFHSKTITLNNPRNIAISIVDKGKTTEDVYSCAVSDENSAGCLFKVNLSKKNNISCFCDSYADFK